MTNRAMEPGRRAESETANTADAHHALPAHQVVLLMETDSRRGLSSEEAARRLEQYGPNILPEVRRGGPIVRFLRQFNHPLVYVLLVAGTVTLLLGEEVDSVVIFAVVAVNAAVGFIQESKAEAALDALRSMVKTEARVRRDGRHMVIPSEDLVPGDVVLVEAGDKVPADSRLTFCAELRVDESSLTGESVTVSKDEVVLPDTTSVADRKNMLYSGTLVTNGSGAGVVVATGAETEIGEIHRLVGTAEQLATPLTKKLARFSKVLTVAILGLAAVTFAIGLTRGQAPAAMFTAAVALAVGAIPEGLPAAVTITLAIGVARMARRRAVIRRMPAVETLGSTTVICSDKTGTLTENQMTVRTIWTPDESHEIDELELPPEKSALWWTLVAGAACNDARSDSTGDPTEVAMLVAAKRAGLGPELAGPRVATIPFSSERKYMATLHDDRLVLAKGAVERMLDLSRCVMGAGGEERALDREEVTAAAEELASGGLRVLATAVGHVDSLAFEAGELEGALVFTGIEAMLDPPRPGAIGAVRSCHAAGIDVKMITGDHATTATAIARRLGIDGEVMTGQELAELDDDEYPDAVSRTSVFARVSPEQKLRLVEGLQARGEIVAMTGDGVNDAPALRQADIGVAMGKGGTEVAKEAADMILTDDDFATIESAVEEGRGIFDNLTKFIVWTLPTNMGEGSVLLIAIIVGATLPILPAQILWINMTTAVALGLMLAFEPKEKDIMERPPRDPNQPLLTSMLVVRTLLVSALLVAGSWWLFEWELRSGASVEAARSAAVNVFVAQKVFYLFSCRSLTHSMREIGYFSNPWIVTGVALQTVAQLAFTYLPVMNRIFETAPIGVDAWLRVIAAAAAGSVLVAIEKRLRLRAGNRSGG